MRRVNIHSLSVSTILTIILITFMTIYAELNSVFKDFLKELTGHHWTSKGVIALVFFVVAYIVLRQLAFDKKDVKKTLNLVVGVALIASITIFGFFLYEFLS